MRATRGRLKMRMIKAFAAIAALMFVAACSSEQAAAPAGTTVTPGSVADIRQNVGDRVYFDTDMSSVREDGRATLTKQAAWLKQYSNYQITVEGHCDERGTREYNLGLGARRAQAMKDYLASLGVSGARLDTISYGKERPVCVESNDACWAQNRRGVSTIKSGSVS